MMVIIVILLIFLPISAILYIISMLGMGIGIMALFTWSIDIFGEWGAYFILMELFIGLPFLLGTLLLDNSDYDPVDGKFKDKKDFIKQNNEDKEENNGNN